MDLLPLASVSSVVSTLDNFGNFVPEFTGVDIGNLDVSWQRSFQEGNRVKRSQGHDTLALSAFMLSSLKTPSARKTLIKEIWESGAHTIVGSVSDVLYFTSRSIGIVGSRNSWRLRNNC